MTQEEEEEPEEVYEEQEQEEENPAVLRKKLSSLFEQVQQLEATLAEKEATPPSKTQAMSRAVTPSPASDHTLLMSPRSPLEVPSVVSPGGHPEPGVDKETPSAKPANRRQRRTLQQMEAKQVRSPAEDAVDRELKAMQARMEEQAAEIQAFQLAKKKAQEEKEAKEAAAKVDPREALLKEMQKKMEQQEALIQSLKGDPGPSAAPGKATAAPEAPAEEAEGSGDSCEIIMPDGAKAQSDMSPSRYIVHICMHVYIYTQSR